MQDYIYNYGLESAKIMNSIYSSYQSLAALSGFLKASPAISKNSTIHPIKAVLPSTVSGVTGSLFLQPTINFSFQSGEYYFSSGSYIAQSDLLPAYDLKYSKLTQTFSSNSYILENELASETINNINSYNYDQYFTLNYSRYDDGTNILFKSRKENGKYENNFIGYSCNTYTANFSQTPFGAIISAYVDSLNESNTAINEALVGSYQTMISEFSNFAQRSYSQEQVLSTMGEYSTNIIDAFSEFANINLNV